MAVADIRTPAISARLQALGEARLAVIGGTVVGFLLLLCMPARLSAYPHDALIQLEGAWRLAQGQQIHANMHTPMGALYPLLLELGVRLFGPLPRAFLVPVLLPLPVLVWASWRVFSVRFSPWASAALCLMIVSILVGPTCLGDPVAFGQNWLRTTFGMQYNRLFWPFATLLAAVCLMPRRVSPSAHQVREDGIFAGVMLGFCFFGKVNFFIAGAPLVAVAFWRCSDRVSWLKGFALSLAAVFAGFWVLNVPIADYLADLRLLTKAQSPVDRLRQIGILAAVNIESVIGIVAVVGALRDRRRTWLPVVAVILLVYGIFVTSANYQERAIPTMVLAIFVLREHFHRLDTVGSDTRRMADKIAYASAGGWIAWTLLSFCAPYGMAVDAMLGRPSVAIPNLYSPYYRASLIPVGSAAEAIVLQTDKQAKKCDELFGKKAIVFRVGWYDVLPVLRQAPSPSGLLWYHNGRTVTRETLPPALRELKGVDGVVWPREPDENDQMLVEEYGPIIQKYFVPLAADDTATYWRRR